MLNNQQMEALQEMMRRFPHLTFYQALQRLPNSRNVMADQGAEETQYNKWLHPNPTPPSPQLPTPPPPPPPPPKPSPFSASTPASFNLGTNQWVPSETFSGQSLSGQGTKWGNLIGQGILGGGPGNWTINLGKEPGNMQGSLSMGTLSPAQLAFNQAMGAGIRFNNAPQFGFYGGGESPSNPSDLANNVHKLLLTGQHP